MILWGVNMSLTIYLEDAPQYVPVVRDVQLEFLKIKLRNTPTTVALLHDIEQGEFLDSVSFKDRFGFKLSTSDMSLGCKAALCAAYCPDTVIDTNECGTNAIDAIIKWLKSGKILLRLPVCLGVSDKIDVMCNGYHFKDGYELCRYIEDDYPYPLGTMDRRVK